MPTDLQGQAQDAKDLYRYGWRDLHQIVDGKEEWVRVPLTEEDVLHPQMDDTIIHTDAHQRLCIYLYTGLRWQRRAWLWVEPVRLWLGQRNTDVAWYEESGSRILDYTEVMNLLGEKRKSIAQLELATEQLSQRNPPAQAAMASQARLAAEEQAQAAEARAAAEAQARLALEERLRALEEQIRNLQGNG